MTKDKAKNSQTTTKATKKTAAKAFKLPKPNKNMTIWTGLGPWPWGAPKE